MTEPIGPFQKSSYSGQENNCVEVATHAVSGRAIRDSKDQAGPILTFTPDGWQAVLTGARSEGFGRAARRGQELGSR